MSRSLKKGPFVDPNVLVKVQRVGVGNTKPIRTWSRACTITPEMVGVTFEVHNGKEFIRVSVIEDMVGHKLGEFSPTRKFRRHGGKTVVGPEGTAATSPTAAPTKPGA
ncbi:30S ribosomal protein S19 [Candidatus Berkelbacteria bacterium]|nr:30S ribosomal protein S19 [Candidatus Berkelbacteria bacterium]